MLIVGVDFGTTNVRVATWDSDAPNTVPVSRNVASGDSKIMSSVIAFRRDSVSDVTVVVGEEADNIENSSDVLVIPNIKRWAMSSDSYMRWHMDARSEEWPTWWDPFNRSVNIWGQEFPVRNLIRDILAKAFQEAGIEGTFEWRAGCPVHSGLDYRYDLTHALSELAGQGNINWVVEEPLLLLALGHRGLSNPEGSYLIYDLGGGSFDSTMAVVHKGGEMVIYGADGHPRIGGSDIDGLLEEKLKAQGYNGSQTSIRVAKEALNPQNSDQSLLGGFTLSWVDLEAALSERGFLQKTSMSTRDAYVSAKWMWNRQGIDELLHQDTDTGEVRFVWQLTYQEMAEEIDNIVLYGGAIRAGSGYFIDKLKKVFGGNAKTASEWLADLDIPDAELLGISLGACYFADKSHFVDKGFSSFVNRLPVRITLQNLHTGESVRYEPFDNLTQPNKPFSEFITGALQQGRDYPQEYELIATTPDGLVLERIPVDGYLEPGTRHPATALRLFVNRFGQVGVEKRSEGVGLTWTKMSLLVDTPPWQTELQRGAMGEGILTTAKESGYVRTGGQPPGSPKDPG